MSIRSTYIRVLYSPAPAPVPVPVPVPVPAQPVPLIGNKLALYSTLVCVCVYKYTPYMTVSLHGTLLMPYRASHHITQGKGRAGQGRAGHGAERRRAGRAERKGAEDSRGTYVTYMLKGYAPNAQTTRLATTTF